MVAETIDLVGKGLLNQLMFSLYPDAETIYREYLQNACDSINEAAELGILSNKNEGHVSINIDKFHHTITIEDNGTGIKAADAELTLKFIARSNKKKESSAGFFGIGRLVGGGYCRQLSFVTSAKGESVKSKLVFDMDRIRQILADEEDDSSATEVIQNVTTFSNNDREDMDKHYFKVILEDILPEYHTILLDEEKINDYLVQVAPIPYEASFYNNLIKPNITKDDSKYLNYYNQLNAIRVSINNFVEIEKPYETKFKGVEKYTDEDGNEIKDNAPIKEIRFFSITDPQLGDLAWGWYAYTPEATQIKEIDPYTHKQVLTRGIRLRCHNIQVGSEKVLDNFFKQERSNIYFNGEVFVLNPNIYPTTDRSNITPTPVTKIFQERLGIFFKKELEDLYQKVNTGVNALKKIRETTEGIRKIEESTEIPAESKASELAKLQEEKAKAENKLNNIIKKKDDDKQTAALRAFATHLQQQSDNYIKTTSSSNTIQSTSASTSKTHTPVNPPKTMEEKISELSDKYNTDEIGMVKKIFSIMDNRYLKNHTQVVKSIKESVLNDLKK